MFGSICSAIEDPKNKKAEIFDPLQLGLKASTFFKVVCRLVARALCPVLHRYLQEGFPLELLRPIAFSLAI